MLFVRNLICEWEVLSSASCEVTRISAGVQRVRRRHQRRGRRHWKLSLGQSHLMHCSRELGGINRWTRDKFKRQAGDQRRPRNVSSRAKASLGEARDERPETKNRIIFGAKCLNFDPTKWHYLSCRSRFSRNIRLASNGVIALEMTQHIWTRDQMCLWRCWRGRYFSVNVILSPFPSFLVSVYLFLTFSSPLPSEFFTFFFRFFLLFFLFLSNVVDDVDFASRPLTRMWPDGGKNEITIWDK